METIKIIEFLGMIMSMTGALYMSRSVLDDENTMFKAGVAFLVANVLMFIVAIANGLGALAIQMTLFYSSSVIVIMSHTKNKELSKKYLIAISITLFFILAFNINSINWNNFSNNPIEIASAIMAITGSFMLKTHNNNIKIQAFLLFLFADIGYAYIGYEKGMYFFMIQAMFFWYTSIRGIKNMLHEKELYTQRILDLKI